ncbi:MAG TPA: Holliday junction resolvase RuvX [Bacteroidales bacterium]|nr:Holliday junction resolvase RuvX [Bacteroidales bacterium]HPS16559.1 Holliday junction resolvase RuvX [Bacteroidales bacterium]
MGRILAIDYGTKRVGLAVTDNLKMIANALTTLHSKDVLPYLKAYTSHEDVECFVVGEPKNMDGTSSESEQCIQAFINLLKKSFPAIPVNRYDERFTSKMAMQTLYDAGLKKKDRQKKELLDSVSATLILQSYLENSIIKK